MKQINIIFEDKEFIELDKIKTLHGGNWHDFIVDISRIYLFQKEAEQIGNDV